MSALRRITTKKNMFRTLILIAALAFSLVCGPQPVPPKDARSVFELRSGTRVLYPTSLIDFGDGRYRSHLVSGWAMKDAVLSQAEEYSGVFSTGPVSRIEFFVAKPQDLEVTFNVASLAGVKEYEVRFEVNQDLWASFVLTPGLNEYTAIIEADKLQAGSNLLTFTHVGEPSSENLVVLHERRLIWDWMRFSVDPAPEAQWYAEGNRIVLPCGSRLDVFLDLEADGGLWVQETRGDKKQCRLELSWSPVDGETAVRVGNYQDGLAKITESAGPGLLSLFAVPRSSEGVASKRSIELINPMILGLASDRKTLNSELKETPTYEASERPNVLLYLVDTLRADHMSCYGYHLKTTPFADEFAESAVIFENAQAQSPWTRASVASIFTGLWPTVHGAQDREDRLSDKNLTAAELMSSAGYVTYGVTANGNAHDRWGFDQGFDEFEYPARLLRGVKSARSTDVNDHALSWLNKYDKKRPFFMWVHTIDPHGPYEPSEPFRSRFSGSVPQDEVGTVAHLLRLSLKQEATNDDVINSLVALYDGEIAANDASFGALLKHLKALDLYDNTLIIFLSDHGEEFYDHGGWSHGKTLRAEMLDTPLIIKPPHCTTGARLQTAVQHVDLLPTLLDYAGIALPELIQGHSLLPLLEKGDLESWRDRHIIAQMDLDNRIGTSMVKDRTKVVQRRFDGFHGFPMLFDRIDDPDEQNNLAAFGRRIGADYSTHVMEIFENEAPEAIGKSKLSLKDNPEIEEQLRALGYVE